MTRLLIYFTFCFSLLTFISSDVFSAGFTYCDPDKVSYKYHYDTSNARCVRIKLQWCESGSSTCPNGQECGTWVQKDVEDYPCSGASIPPSDAITAQPPYEEPRYCSNIQTEYGSRIDPVSKIFMDSIPLYGTGFTLSYSSGRVPGRKADFKAELPITGGDASDKVMSKYYYDLAGATFGSDYFQYNGQEVKEIEWNGNLQVTPFSKLGRGIAVVADQSVYPCLWLSTYWECGPVWPEGIFPPKVYEYSQIFYLGNWDARYYGLGGWTLDPLHFYDADHMKMYRGNGSAIGKPQSPSLVSLHYAGAQTSSTPSGDGGTAISANLARSYDLKINGDNLYYAQSDRIRKIDLTTGNISAYAGGGTTVLSGGSSATPTSVNLGTIVSIFPTSSRLWILSGSSKLYKVESGTLYHVAGGGTSTADGTTATSASLSGAVDIIELSDGKIVIAQSNSGQKFRYIDGSGKLQTLHTVTGTVTDGFQLGLAEDSGYLYYIVNKQTYQLDLSTYSQKSYISGEMHGVKNCEHLVDGTPRLKAANIYQGRIQKDVDGNLLVMSGYSWIRRVSDRDTMATLIGRCWDIDPKRVKPSFPDSGGTSAQAKTDYDPTIHDFKLSASAELHRLDHFAVAPDGSIYVSVYNPDDDTTRIQRFKPMNSTHKRGFAIPDSNGELLHIFAEGGKIVETKSGLNGKTLYTFTYDGSNHITKIEDQFSNSIDVTYGTGTATISFPNGEDFDLVLNSDNYLTSVTSPLSKVHSFTYRSTTDDSKKGLLTEIEYPDNSTKTMTYTEDSQDPFSDGILTKVTNPEGGYKEFLDQNVIGSFRYSSSSFKTKVGRRKYNSGSSRGQSITHMSGRTESYTYDRNYEDSIDYIYDTNQENTKKMISRYRNEIGHPLYGYYLYNLGEISTSFGSNLVSKRIEAHSTTNGSRTELFDYSSVEWQSQVSSNTHSTKYEPSTNKFTKTTAEGRVATTTRNSDNLVTKVELPYADDIDYTYNSDGSINTITQKNRSLTLGYDTRGYIKTVTDALSRVTTYNRNAEGKVTSIVRNDNKTITFAYDDLNYVDEITPPSKPKHYLTNSSLGNLLEYLPPTLTGISAPETTYSYDDDQLLTGITRPDGKSITVNYGTLTGLITSMTSSDGNFTFSYEPNSERISRIIGPDSIENRLSYIGPFVENEILFDASLGTVSDLHFSYNEFGLASVRFEDSLYTHDYSYDKDGLLIGAGKLFIHRNPTSGLVDYKRIGDAYSHHEFNDYGELDTYYADISGSEKYRVVLTRNNGGEITKKVETINGTTSTWDYTYDSIGRLKTSKLNTILQRTYNYDDNGNRTSMVDSSGTTTGSYDNQDRLTSYGNINYSYNANGDLTSKTDTGVTPNLTTNYTYDVYGNLTKVALPNSTTIDYEVDGYNRRVSRDNGTTKKYYLYQDQLKIIAKLDSSGDVLQRYIWGDRINAPEGMIDSNGIEYMFVTDHLGSIVQVIQASGTNKGTITQQITYDEFGNVLSDSNQGFQPFGFAGGIYDHQTGLVRFGVRDYDAEVGRWLTKDPIRFDGGTNHYEYTFSDPVNLVDVNGLYASVPVTPSGPWYDRDDNGINGPILGGAPVVGPGVIGAIRGGARAVARGAVLSRVGRYFFGRGSWLNKGPNLRIGIGRKGGRQVFRIGGKYLEKVTGKNKCDIVDLGPL